MSGKVQSLISCLKYNNRNVHCRHGLRKIFWQRNSRRTLLKKQSVFWMPLEYKYCSFEDISRMETNAKSVVTSLDNATYQIKRNKRYPRPSFYTKRRRDNERIKDRTRADYARTPDGTTRIKSRAKALSVKSVNCLLPKIYGYRSKIKYTRTSTRSTWTKPRLHRQSHTILKNFKFM